MISFTDCVLKELGWGNSVIFNFNKIEKSAKCECGNKWVPLSFNDIKCKKCNGGINK